MTEPTASQDKLPLVPMLGSLVLAIACAVLFWWLFMRPVAPDTSGEKPNQPALPLMIVSYPEDETLIGPKWSDEGLGISMHPPAGFGPASDAEVARVSSTDGERSMTIGVWTDDELGVTISLKLLTPPEEGAGAEWIARNYIRAYLEGDPDMPDTERAKRQDYARLVRILVGGKHVMYRVSMLLGNLQAASILGDVSEGRILQLSYGVEGEYSQELDDRLTASLGTLEFPPPPVPGGPR